MTVSHPHTESTIHRDQLNSSPFPTYSYTTLVSQAAQLLHVGKLTVSMLRAPHV